MSAGSNHRVEELLAEIEALDSTLSANTTSAIDQTVRLEQLERLAGPAIVDRDSYVVVSVAEDAMSASITLYPPAGAGVPVTRSACMQALVAKDVREGVDDAAIDAAIQRCNSEQRIIAGVVVARGREPDHGRSAHIALLSALVQKRPRDTDPTGRRDYLTDTPFVLVAEHQEVARLIRERAGIPGVTVSGTVLPAQVRVVPGPAPGTNIRAVGDRFLAAISGRLEWDKKHFFVNEVLEIEGNVDYHTGHIDFPGDVLIRGEVRDQFHVHAGGSVYCMGTLDASNVECGGDLVAHRGIIGRKQSSVIVHGRLRAKYVENCHVEADGDVVVDTGIINSSVSSLGTVLTGRRGVIVGGEIRATHGIRAAQIGTSTGPRTFLECGTDFKVVNRLGWVRERGIEIAVQLDRLGRREKDDGGRSELRTRLEAAQRRLQDAALSLIERLDVDDQAVVDVTGSVYDGTYVEICHVSHEVQHAARSIRFRLDKVRGSVEPLRLR